MPFICDVCGEEGDEMPYVCVLCAFLIHGECIDLPRIININRHDHRMYFTHHLGPDYLKCGVCHLSLNQYHGTYSCSVCPNYAAHSRCVVRSGVWDGVELEGIPDDTKYIAPFKVVADDLIVHFSHKDHTLRLHKDNVTQSDRWLQCEACMYPVVFDSIYVCDECGYVLHEKCANLPMKKRLIFDTVPYTLEAHTLDYIDCHMCRTLSDGFLYKSQSQKWNYKDVHCGSLSEPLYHDGHLHPLYFHETRSHHCHGCHDVVHGYVLRCDACNFVLCSYCASLPEKICHMNEENPLTLYYDEKGNNKNWCDNCENQIDPCKWFYICFDCEVILHARCVLGEFSRLKLGRSIGTCSWDKFTVVPNNHNTRPLCIQCQSRCKFSVILNQPELNIYICSLKCLSQYRWLTFQYRIIRRL